MGGRSAKVKGSGFEREIVNLLKEAGIDAHRVPFSGAMNNNKGDVTFHIDGEKIITECKRRRSGFKTLYGWLGANKVLFFRDDNCEPLAVIRAKDYARLVA